MSTLTYPVRSASREAAVSVSEKAVSFLLAFSLFTFPLQTVGFALFGYPVTLPIISLALLSLLLVFRPFRLTPCWRTAALFVIWSAGTAAATANFLSLRSVAVLAILLMPTVIAVPQAARSRAVVWFLRGGILNLALVAFDTARLMFGLPQLDQFTSIIMPGSVEELDFRYAGFPRVKALFLEPSYCAMYLAFLIIFLDLAPDEYLSRRKRNVLRILFIGGLLLSRGMAGFAILGAYAGARILCLAYRQIVRPRISWRAAAAAVLVAASLSIAFLWRDEISQISKSSVVPQRLEEALTAFSDPFGHRGSSEAERLGALSIASSYLANGSVEQALAGEGFNSSEEWVAKTYTARGTDWSVGRIANVFSGILLGTGLVGLALYFAYLLGLRPGKLSSPDPRRFAAQCFFGAVILAHFATGMVIGYFVWGLLYTYLFALPPKQAERRRLQ